MKEKQQEPLYSISVAARLIGVSPRVLRTYEEAELITPHRTRGKTRFYSNLDIKKLQLISYLHREECVNLPGIKVILEIMTGEKTFSKLTGLAQENQPRMQEKNENNEE